MSLIQDALKRQPEKPHPAPGTPGSPLAPPAPRPNPPFKNKEPASRNLILSLIAILVLVLLALGLNLFRQPRQANATPPPEPAAETPPSVAPHPVAIVQPAPLPQYEPAPAPEPHQKISWPELKLSGFAGTGSSYMASIDGRTLSDGQSINGMKVIRVGEKSVLLEYHGEKRVFWLDGK